MPSSNSDLVYGRKKEVFELLELAPNRGLLHNANDVSSTHIKGFLFLAVHWLGIGVKERLLHEALALEDFVLRSVLRVLRLLEPEGRSNESLLIDQALLVRNVVEGIKLALTGHVRAQQDEVGQQLAVVDGASAVGVQVANQSHELGHLHLDEGLGNGGRVAVEAARVILAALEEVVNRLQAHAILIVDRGH